MSAAELLASAAPTFSGGSLSIRGKEVITATSFAAPNTALPSAAIIVNGQAAQPTLNLTLQQTAPLLAAGGSVLQCYSTQQATPANAVMVASPATMSGPQTWPAYSVASAGGGGAPGTGGVHLQALAGDAIQCPTITATSTVLTWIAGLPGTVGATACLPATISAIVPGTGFTLNGTVGVQYGYLVLYG